MVKRKIIKIDEDKCDGCGLCVPACAEGALQIVDGKARLVSDKYCDGLGACLGECPQDAISFEEREAEEFDEEAVKERLEKEHDKAHHQGCPGSAMQEFKKEEARASELHHWPVQLHLINPLAPYFQGSDLVLSADCVAYAYGDFHRSLLKGKSLIIACPKLDEGKDVYIAKISALIDQAKINTLTVVMMEVPCCGGLLQIAKEGAANAKRVVPIKSVVIGIRGEFLREEWVR